MSGATTDGGRPVPVAELVPMLKGLLAAAAQSLHLPPGPYQGKAGDTYAALYQQMPAGGGPDVSGWLTDTGDQP